MVSGAVEARGDEIALAKLRGLRPSRTVLFALAEPVSLLVLAAPLGLVCALVATHLLTDAALVDGTPVALTGTTGLALAAAFAGSAAGRRRPRRPRPSPARCSSSGATRPRRAPAGAGCSSST